MPKNGIEVKIDISSIVGDGTGWSVGSADFMPGQLERYLFYNDYKICKLNEQQYDDFRELLGARSVKPQIDEFTKNLIAFTASHVDKDKKHRWKDAAIEWINKVIQESERTTNEEV